MTTDCETVTFYTMPLIVLLHSLLEVGNIEQMTETLNLHSTVRLKRALTPPKLLVRLRFVLCVSVLCYSL